MWKGRIQPIKTNGGATIVSDEEGFININKFTREVIFARVEDEAAKSIDLFAAWGEADKQVYGEHKHLTQKIKMIINLEI